MWLWQSKARGRDGVAIDECPVSYVTGESLAHLEDFHAQQALGKCDDILEWPARRVDAHLTLKAEQRKVELEGNGQ
ncbi:MAG TPA: hypothetical protein VET69_00895 [Terriglobales bacterium]|nr:hypothetical protein [Terriglobales bacterium]